MVKTIINHPPVITIYIIGAMFTIPSHGKHGSQVPVEVPELHAVELLTELPKPQYEKVPKEIPLCHGRIGSWRKWRKFGRPLMGNFMEFAIDSG